MKRLILFCLIGLITSCGFKLRGWVEMPTWLNNVAIIVRGAHHDLIPMLKDSLQAYRIHVTDNPSQASYLLILERDAVQQQITSVGASTNSRQYLLIYTLQYSLLKVGGEQVITSRTVTSSRQLTVNNNRILGSDNEETMLYHEMRQDAVRQIVNQLSQRKA
ncbi:Rare lipoprotein B [Legionella beliardensis]|uniref:LPS-assembly lipoprotein LptE n=1 Tax=Legionella beliardensis TaxID=91822 RepID=A0A378I1J8_9GAMM|nr:LPS assembly lipoprotein LptE [Legionella beliardensis]STX29029.1 Rare lipoprotein B [Legionella beliardensis]